MSWLFEAWLSFDASRYSGGKEGIAWKTMATLNASRDDGMRERVPRQDDRSMDQRAAATAAETRDDALMEIDKGVGRD